MNKPTGIFLFVFQARFGNQIGFEECFYNKDGKWYYAGIYKGFRLEDLSTKEWDALSNEVGSVYLIHHSILISTMLDVPTSGEGDDCLAQEHIATEFL